MNVLTQLISAIICLMVAVPSIAVARPDPNAAKLGISLGSDAYFAKMTDSGVRSTDLSLLVPPGTPLLLFPEDRRYRDRTLALSNLGIWLFVPTDASNLIPEPTLLYALKDRLRSDRRWVAFAQRTSVTDMDCVTFTPGEIALASGLDGTTDVTVHLSGDHPILSSKFRDVRAACPEVSGSATALTIPAAQSYNAIEITDFFADQFRDHLTATDIDRLVSSDRTASIVRKAARAMYADWPKLIELGPTLTYGCDTKSVAEAVSSEETLERSFTAKIGAALEFLSIEGSSSYTRTTSVNLQSNQEFRTGYSVNDVAEYYIDEDGSHYLTFGQVSACKKAADDIDYYTSAPPFWHRMHWEGTSPFLVDFRNYEVAAKAGLTWNKSTGYLEVSCFHVDYPKLRAKLLDTMTSRQAQIFMLRYVRPAGGRWREVYKCDTPSPQQSDLVENNALSG